MNAADLAAAIPTFRTDEARRVDVNDWAVNTLRDWAAERGWSKADMETALREEIARIQAGSLDLAGYLRCSRTGSRFILHRGIRVAIFAIYATRIGYLRG